ncbi:hypothetical protein KAH37_06320 [bacterium]|nr:hypothetical protein [bacterium]
MRKFLLLLSLFFFCYGCSDKTVTIDADSSSDVDINSPFMDNDTLTDRDTDTEAPEVPDLDNDITTDADVDERCLDLRIPENVIKTPFPFKDKDGKSTFCRPGCDTPTETDPQCVRNIWEWDNWTEYQVYLAAQKKDPNQTLERECYPWPCKLPDMKAKTQKEIKTLVSKCDRWLTVNEFTSSMGIVWSHGMSNGVAGMDFGHSGRVIEYNPEKDEYSTVSANAGQLAFNENRYVYPLFDRRRTEEQPFYHSFVISALKKDGKYYYELIYDNEKHNSFMTRPALSSEQWVLIQVSEGADSNETEVKYAKAGVWEWQTIGGIDYHLAQEGNIVGDHLTFITNNRDMYYCDLRTAPKHIGNCLHINRPIEDGEFEQGHEPRIDVENEYRLVYNIDNSKIFVEVDLSDINNPIYTEHLITPSDETTWAVSPNMLQGNIVSYTEAFQILYESWQADFKGCFYRFDTKKSYCSNPVFEQTPGYANVSLMGYNVFWGKWHLWKMIGRTATLMRDWECYCEETGICPLTEEK